jgi:hypothetical protein
MERTRNLDELLKSMLRHGLLLIRASGLRGEPGLCELEADHLHNLPTLLSSETAAELLHYWDVERPAYIDRSPESHRASWELYWSALEPHVAQARSQMGERIVVSP